jgi:hypothetical protein
MTEALGKRLVEAIAAQDTHAIAMCFAADAQFRALVPPGARERTGSSDTAALIAAWFADSTELDLVALETDEVGDRFHVAYRFEGVEAGEPYVVEQQLYGSLRDGKIERADLLCSGFRPRQSAFQKTVVSHGRPSG